jgi:hypothetical protein
MAEQPGKGGEEDEGRGERPAAATGAGKRTETKLSAALQRSSVTSAAVSTPGARARGARNSETNASRRMPGSRRSMAPRFFATSISQRGKGKPTSRSRPRRSRAIAFAPKVPRPRKMASMKRALGVTRRPPWETKRKSRTGPTRPVKSMAFSRGSRHMTRRSFSSSVPRGPEKIIRAPPT